MDYWGSIVMARPTGVLVAEPAVELFGYQHRWLRELGGGWQLLETNGWAEPPDLVVATGGLSDATGWPVLAGYVSDGDCALVCGAVSASAVWTAHLPDVTEPCDNFVHQPKALGRSATVVLADLRAWASAAGLSPAVDVLWEVVGYRYLDDEYGMADDIVFALVAALGVERIGRVVPHRFRVDASTLSMFTDAAGLAGTARSRAAFRQHADTVGVLYEPEEPWEPAAIELECDIWTALYDDSVAVAELVSRAEWVQAVYEAVRVGKPVPSRHVMLGDREIVNPHHIQETLYDGLAVGRLNPGGRIDLDAQVADRQAGEVIDGRVVPGPG